MIFIGHLTKTYISKSQTVRALSDVDLSFGDSGMVFILGKSGSGKTTLLNMLGAIDGFDGGEIEADGRKLSEMTEKDRCAFRNCYVGFVFQEYNLIDDFDVEENISLARELQCKEPLGDVSELLEKLELNGLNKRRVSELSGGQRQRVAIARALVKDPRVILADEPTGALDSESGENLMRLLKDISKDRLVVVVSHDRDFAERFGDRIIELKDGRVVSDSAPAVEKRQGGALTLSTAKLKSARAVGMGIKTAFKKPVRLVLSTLLLAITVCLLGISCTVALFDRDMAIKRTVYNSDREYTVETARYVTDGTNIMHAGDRDIRMLMDDGDSVKYTELTGLPCLGFVGRSYLYENNIANPPPENNSESADLYFGACSALTEQTVRDFEWELHGALPKADNEIVITKYSLRAFMKYGYTDGEDEFTISSAEDMIGKTLELRRRAITQNYTVCGVITDLDFDSDMFDETIDSTPEPYLKDNLENERKFYEYNYPYMSVFFSPNTFEFEKEHVDNILFGVGLINPNANYENADSAYGARDLYIQKNGRNISSLGLFVFESDKYNDAVTEEMLFGDSLTDGQCALSLYEFFALTDELDIALDGTDRAATGCESLNEYIEKNFFNREKIGQIIEEDYGDLINDRYTKEDRIAETYLALRYGSYDIYGDSTIVKKLYDGIADVVAKYARGMPVKTGGTSAMVKDFALSGIVFENRDRSVSANGLLCLTEKDAAEISYGAYDNYYDYLLSAMPSKRNAVYALYDDGVSDKTGLHFVMENFEKDAVTDFELQLTVAKQLSFVLCGVLAVFAVILLFNFVLSSIAFREKDIRILKNLGAGRSEIDKIFFAESLLTVVFAFVLGVAAVGIGIWVFNGYYASIIHPALSALAFEWYLPLLLLAGALAIAIAVFAISMRLKRL